MLNMPDVVAYAILAAMPSARFRPVPAYPSHTSPQPVKIASPHGASASYLSEVLPFDKSNPEGIDYLQQAVAACSERGIKVHVWMTNFKARGHAPASLVEQFDAEGRFAVQSDGTVLDTLCPSDLRNQDLQIAAMIEAAHLPGVAGIHFRAPGGEVC